VLQIIGIVLGIFGLLEFWIAALIINIFFIVTSKQKINLIKINLNDIYIGTLTKSMSIIVIILIINSLLENTQISLDGDALTHYAQYYNEVISSGSLRPNDIWYHFFYTKGDGNSFLTILLSDISSKLLLSYSYLIFICLIIFDAIYKNTKTIFWSLFGVYLYLILMTIDSGGAFFKQHLFIAFNLSAIYHLMLYGLENKLSSKFLILFPISSICLISPPASIYILGLLVGFILWCFANKTRGYLYSYIKIGLFTLLLVATVLFYNYLLTGLYEITPYRIFTEVGNYLSISQWISPYLITYLDQGSNPNLGKILFESNNVLDKISKELRWDILNFVFPRPLLLLSGVSAICYIFLKKFRTEDTLPVYLAIVLCSLACIAFLTVSQSTSIYRSTSFITIFLAIIFAIGFFLLESILGASSRFTNKIFIRQSTTLIVFLYFSISIIKSPSLLDSYKLSLSLVSVDTFYKKYASNYDSIVLDLRSRLGKDVKILNLAMPSNQLGRGLLVGAGIQTEVSYSIGPMWHQSVFESPKISSDLLKDLDINYFLLNRKNIGIGGIPHSSLFSDKNMNFYFKVIYENESWVALTWIDNNLPGRELNQKELRDWGRLRSEPASFIDLFNQVQGIYNYNNGNINMKPAVPPNLAPAKGWQ
jgi:hypothetical protein